MASLTQQTRSRVQPCCCVWRVPATQAPALPRRRAASRGTDLGGIPFHTIAFDLRDLAMAGWQGDI